MCITEKGLPGRSTQSAAAKQVKYPLIPATNTVLTYSHIPEQKQDEQQQLHSILHQIKTHLPTADGRSTVPFDPLGEALEDSSALFLNVSAIVLASSSSTRSFGAECQLPTESVRKNRTHVGASISSVYSGRADHKALQLSYDATELFCCIETVPLPTRACTFAIERHAAAYLVQNPVLMSCCYQPAWFSPASRSMVCVAALPGG